MRAFAITVCLSFAGCVTYSSIARHRFGWDNTCPEQRVTVADRDDLVPHVLLHEREPDPTSEIASDPERLALWHQHWSEAFSYEDHAYAVREVSGCGLSRVFLCKTISHGRTRSVQCAPAPLR